MAVRANTGQSANSVSMLGQRRIAYDWRSNEPAMGCDADPTLNRYWVGRPTFCVPGTSYSVKRSEVTRWKQGYITPPPILHSVKRSDVIWWKQGYIRTLPHTSLYWPARWKGGRGHWVSQNRRVHHLAAMVVEGTRWRYTCLFGSFNNFILDITGFWSMRKTNTAMFTKY